MEILFYFHALVAVVSMAYAMMVSHTVHALLALIFSLLSLSVSMYIIAAPLAAVLEVVVYAGAIMVLFAFAIMLLQIPAVGSQEPASKASMLWAVLACAVFFGELGWVLEPSMAMSKLNQPDIKEIAASLFQDYGFLVELASFVLLAGLASAVYVSKNLMALTRHMGGNARDST